MLTIWSYPKAHHLETMRTYNKETKLQHTVISKHHDLQRSEVSGIIDSANPHLNARIKNELRPIKPFHFTEKILLFNKSCCNKGTLHRCGFGNVNQEQGPRASWTVKAPLRLAACKHCVFDEASKSPQEALNRNVASFIEVCEAEELNSCQKW